MRMPGRRPAAELAADLWETDLACQSANEQAWATGLPPSVTGAGWRAASLNSRMGRLHGGLRRRAGHLAEVPLEHLANADVVDGKVMAAAALRVLESGAHLADSESLQPGVELPPVGIYGRVA